MRPDLAHRDPLDAYGALCATLPHTPLRVTVQTLTPVVSLDLLNFDGLLAKAMVLATWGTGVFPASESPYWLPLPLAYTEHVGLPLWHATTLFRVGGAEGATHYHKRTEDNPYSLLAIRPALGQRRPRRQPSTAAGQYMNYRIPEPYQVAEYWECLCLGHAGELARLLPYLQGIGKDCAQGYGRILGWTVEPHDGPLAPDDTDEVWRPTPTTTVTGVLSGWTPPYWRRDLWLPCRVPSLTGPPWAS